MTQEIDPKVLELATKLLAKKEKQAAERTEEIARKYPHALTETLSYDVASKKVGCNIRCVVCGDEGRRVHTSDLFQVQTCTKCSEIAAKAARSEKKALLKQAMEVLKAKRGA